MKKGQEKTSYIDSSVILRHAVLDKNAIKNLDEIAPSAATSVLAQIECFRVLDRWRITREASDQQIAHAWTITNDFFHALKLIPISNPVVELAGQSFPIALKSLDAIHLASALLLKKKYDNDVIMVTHDAKLALASAAMDLATVGV